MAGQAGNAAGRPSRRRGLARDRYTGFALIHHRILSTMTDDTRRTPLSDPEYQALAGSVLASVEAQVDRWLEDEVVDIDTHRTGGLLELSFPNGSKIILNTQPPLQELWLAARSGGFHYRYQDGQWRDTRDGRELFEALSGCATEQAGIPLRLAAPG
jgi:CyaY protein